MTNVEIRAFIPGRQDELLSNSEMRTKISRLIDKNSISKMNKIAKKQTRGMEQDKRKDTLLKSLSDISKGLSELR